MVEISLFHLLSALTVVLVSIIPFYFSYSLARLRRSYALLSLALALTLLVHGAHHVFVFVELTIPALGAGQVSAILAIAFGILYYTTWRSEAVD